VPALRRLGTGQQQATIVISRILQRIILRRFTRASVWGLYDSKGLVVACDSIVSFDFRGESKIAEIPLQAGGFAAYNKVQLPNAPTIRMTKGGTDAARNTLLTAIELARQTTDLYSIVTPDKTYFNVSVESYDYRRTAQDGVSLLIVDVRLKEIRQVTPAFSTVKLSNVKNPSAVSQQNSGFVQPSTVPTKSESSILSKIFSFIGG